MAAAIGYPSQACGSDVVMGVNIHTSTECSIHCCSPSFSSFLRKRVPPHALEALGAGHKPVLRIAVKSIMHAPERCLEEIPFFEVRAAQQVGMIASRRFGTHISACEELNIHVEVKRFTESGGGLTTLIIKDPWVKHMYAVTLVRVARKIYAMIFDSSVFDHIETLNKCGIPSSHIFQNTRKTQSDTETCSVKALSFATQSQYHLGRMTPPEILDLPFGKSGKYPETWVLGTHSLAACVLSEKTAEVLDEVTGEVIPLRAFRERYTVKVPFTRKTHIELSDGKRHVSEEVVEKKWNVYSHRLGAHLLASLRR